MADGDGMGINTAARTSAEKNPFTDCGLAKVVPHIGDFLITVTNLLNLN
jgi:hypothetical protein